jgi:hypothetical protein
LFQCIIVGVDRDDGAGGDVQHLYVIFQTVSAQTKEGKAIMSQFWGAHQRFFRQMLLSAKVPLLAKMANEAVENNMCVVIGLQSTGEAGINKVRVCFTPPPFFRHSLPLLQLLPTSDLTGASHRPTQIPEFPLL